MRLIGTFQVVLLTNFTCGPTVRCYCKIFASRPMYSQPDIKKITKCNSDQKKKYINVAEKIFAILLQASDARFVRAIAYIVLVKGFKLLLNYCFL